MLKAMGMREFGELVRSTRERNNVRGYDLAFALGQTPSWVSRLESGGMTHPPSPAVLDVLAERLGLTVREMLAEMGYERLNEEWRTGGRPEPTPLHPRLARVAERLGDVPITDKNLTALERVVEALIEYRPYAGEAVEHGAHPDQDIGARG
jgi:transcriptional regulator with XRE-family HTH domain